MKELSSQQWRALAQAYPFYLSCAEGGCNAKGHLGRGRGSDLIQNTFATPTISETQFFLQYVVPRVIRVFPEELDAYEKDGASRVRGDPTDNDELDATSSHVATEAVDALLRYLFGCDSPVLSGVSLGGQQNAKSQITFAQHMTPLSQGELRLLGLYHRKQQQYSNLLSNQQQLLAASHLAVQTLQRASGPIMIESRGSEPAAQRWTNEMLAPLTCENLTLLDHQRGAGLWPSMSSASPSHPRNSAHVIQAESASPAPGQNGVKGGAAGPIFTSVLASIPYGGHTSETPAGAAVTAGDPSVADTPGASLLRCADAENAPALIMVNRCAGCQEVGGDLLVCTQCGEIRHEVCGGPHPPEVSKVKGGMPTVNVCRRCAKALNLSSSSSSLRSSTSTSERAALDDYFGTEDDDSSLSGFIVNTSDDEEGEEEGADEARSAGNAGSGSEEEGTTRNGGDKVRHERYPSKKTRPLSHRTGRQADKSKQKRTSGAVASDISSMSSDASASSSCIWSRSASLDRALAGTAKKKTEPRSAKKGGVGHRSVDVRSQREDRRRQREKRRRRSGEDNGAGRRRPHRRRTGDDSADASSAPNTSSDSSPSPTKESRRLETRKAMSSQQQPCTRRPESRKHRGHIRQLAAHTGEGGTVDSPGDRCHTELSSAQPDRKMVLEDEEELSALGIASSALGGAQLQPSPSSTKQRQGGIANLRVGRKNIMDIGSSSSSEDTD